jgi:hypothetical protein
MENCKISKTGQTPFTKLDLLRELNINNNPFSAFQCNILKPLVNKWYIAQFGFQT